MEALCKCSLCKDFWHDPRTLECQHIFCFECLICLYVNDIQEVREWRYSRKPHIECPYCRQITLIRQVEQLPKNFFAAQVLDFLNYKKTEDDAVIRGEDALDIALYYESEKYPSCLYWWELSALSNGAAAEILAGMYASGKKYVDQDYRKAYMFYEKAAEMGEIDAMYKLVEAHEKWPVDSDNVPWSDADKIETWLKRAGQCGHGGALYMLGMRDYRNGDYEQALQKFERGMSVDTMGQLCVCYAQGQGTPNGVDLDRAYYWGKKFARTGKHNVKGMTYMGILYMNYPRYGITDVVQKKRAYKWFNRAMSRGYAYAHVYSAMTYMNGWMKPKRAVDTIQNVLCQKFGIMDIEKRSDFWGETYSPEEISWYHLGQLYWLHARTLKNVYLVDIPNSENRTKETVEEQGLQYLRKAAERGHQEAQEELEMIERIRKL